TPAAAAGADRARHALRVPSPRELGATLAGELLDLPEPARVVLDDLHEAGGGDVCAFLAALLETPPPGLRLFITARTEPELPLARLRLRDQVTDLRGADLLFTPGEVGDLLAAIHGDAAAASRRETGIVRRTGGWAAGVRLAAHAGPQDESLAGMNPLSGEAETLLISSLLEETLRDLPPAQRHALRCAALLDRFRGDILAAALPGEDAAIDDALAFARAADLCRPSAADGSGWWEFHAVYRSALRRQLAESVPAATLAGIHRAIAGALSAAGLPGPGIAHRLAAGDAHDAVAVVEGQISATLDREDWPELAAWLAALPEDLVETRPRLLLARAWIAHLRGRHLLLRDILGRVEPLLRHAGPGEPHAAALAGELDVLRLSGASPAQADPAASIALCKSALSRLPAGWRYARGFAEAHLGHALACSGDLEAAEALLTRQWTTCGDRPDSGSVRGLLALVAVDLQHGDGAVAEVHASALRALSASGNLRLSLGWARYHLAGCALLRGAPDETIAITDEVAADHSHVNLVCLRESLFLRAIAATLLGDPGEARHSLDWSRDRLLADGAVEHLEIVASHAAWIALLLGDHPAAANWARGANATVGWTPLQATVHPVLVRAAALIAGGDEEETRRGLDALAPLQERATRLGFALPIAQAGAIEAIGRMRLGQPAPDASLAALPGVWKRQLSAIWPDESARLFRDLAGGPESGASALALPLLSRREREIVGLLQGGLSYSEIADRCYISPHTVKRHVTSIYRKLGVGNRREAMAAIAGARA
ncbi:MAG: LuxR C-terminal-related transcriptional regulator, partial [Chloroflexota bacterium]